MRETDLKWAQELVKKKEAMKDELEREEEEERREILSKRGELQPTKDSEEKDSITDVK